MIDTLCRTCLRWKPRGSSIVEFCIEEGLHLYEIIMSFCQVKIKFGNNFPLDICSTCLSDIKNAYSFKIMCEKSQNILEEKYSHLNDEKESRNLPPRSAFEDSADQPNYSFVFNGEFEAFDHDVDNDDDLFESKDDIIKLDDKQTTCIQVVNGEEFVKTEEERDEIEPERNEHSGRKRKCSYRNRDVLPNKHDELVEEKPFSCDLCDYRCSRKYNMKKHRLRHVGKLEPPEASTSMITRMRTKHIQNHAVPNDGEEVKRSCDGIKNESNETNPDWQSTGGHCPFCNVHIKAQSKYEEHVRIHTGEKPFACDLCDFRTARKWYLNKHAKSHRNRRMYKCKLCSFKCINARSIRLHSAIHQPDVVMENGPMMECDVIIEQDDDEKPDVKLEDRAKAATEGNTCKLCNRTFSQSFNLKKHLQSKSCTKRPYACLFCKTRFVTSEGLQRHIKIHKGIRSDAAAVHLGNIDLFFDPTDNTKRCPLCNIVVSCRTKFEQHLRVHSSEKPFGCQMCAYSTARFSNLKSHSMKVHKMSSVKSETNCKIMLNTNSACAVEQTYSSTNETLDENNSNLFENDNIGLSDCADDSLLNNTHPDGNNSEIPMECDDKTVIKKEENPDFKPPGKCPICNVYLRCDTSSEKHMRIHTRGHLFVCDFCDYEDTSMHNLGEHTKGSHCRKSRFLCTYCKYKTRNYEKLKIHIGIRHVFDSKECVNKLDGSVRIKTEADIKMENTTRKLTKKTILKRCPVCNIYIRTKRRFDEHMKMHNGRKPFACKICPYRASKTEYMVRHQKIHERDNVSVLKRPLKLEMPMLDVSLSPLPKKCPQCSVKISGRSRYEEHMNVHTGEKPIVCDMCDYRCRYKWSLKNHRERYHGVKYIYKHCPFCKYKTYIDDNLSEHIKTHHQSTNNFKMLTQKVEAKTKKIVRDVPSSVRVGETDKVQERKRCLICGIYVGKRFEAHMRTHAEDKSYSCRDCSYMTHDLYRLTQHSVHHNKEKKKLQDLSDQYIKSDGKMFECGLCGLKMEKKWNLLIHLKRELKLPTKCKYCSFATLSSMKLNLHIKNHELQKRNNRGISKSLPRPNSKASGRVKKEKMDAPAKSIKKIPIVRAVNVDVDNRVCPICGLYCPTHLNRHMKTHTGEKPFACNLCSYNTAFKSNLNKHVQNMHGRRKRHKCPHCNYDSFQLTVLEEHIKKHKNTKLTAKKNKNLKTATNGRQASKLLNIPIKIVNASDVNKKPSKASEEAVEVKQQQVPLTKKDINRYKKVMMNELKSKMKFPRKCSICGRHIQKLLDYKTHMRMHLGQKIFACSYCDFKSVFPWNFRNHLKLVHNDDKEKACSHCDYKSSLLAHLRKHLKDSHGRELLTCPRCPFYCEEKSRLMLHHKKHHSKSENGRKSKAATQKRACAGVNIRPEWVCVVL